VRLLSFAKGYGELCAQFISQRSDWFVFQISATCTVGPMRVKLQQNPFKNAIQKIGERGGRNPQTGDDLMLGFRRVVTFRSSEVLRGKLNGVADQKKGLTKLSRLRTDS